MRRHRTIIVLFVAALTAGMSLPAQPATGQTRDAQRLHGSETQPLPRPDDVPVRFVHLTAEDGLVDQQTTAVVQDSQGFMWIGTWSGLERFDGYAFKHYSYDPEATVNPPGEVIALHMDDEGVMWIGQRRGFSRFDPSTEVFTHYVHDPDDLNSPLSGQGRAIYRGRDGILWIGQEGGLSRFDPSTERFTSYVHDEDDPASLLPGRVRAVYEDREGMIWAGTWAGLSRLDPATQAFTRYGHDPGDPRSLSPGSVESIYEDRKGVLWVGAWGLNRFDRQTGTFERFFPDPRYPHWEDMAEPAPVNNIRAIYEDRDGALWVGCSWGNSSDGGGLYRFDRQTGVFTPYGQGPSGPHSLVDDHVQGIHQDRQGSLWVATGSGVSRMGRTARGFKLYPFEPDRLDGLHGRSRITPFVDREGMLWLGAGPVLNRFDRTAGVVTYFTYDSFDPDKAPGWIHAINQDQHGTMWFGTWGAGLYRFDRATETFTRYAHDPDDPASLGSPIVTAILEDRQGTLWVGGRRRGGDGPYAGIVSRFNRVTGRFTRYALGKSVLTTMYEDQAGVIWIGHEQGVSRMHVGGADTANVGNNDGRSATAPVTFTHYVFSPDVGEEVSHNNARSFVERAQEPGILWIATNGGGLVRFDTRTGGHERFIEQSSGLDRNFINNILADGEGRLWMSTNGITRFDPDTGLFRTYDSDDGLPINSYAWLSAHRSHTGELFFGGRLGLTAFFPEEVEDNPHAPEVAFTGLRLFNEPVEPGPDAPLKTSLAETEAITLRHSQNDVSFDYVGLHFSNPAKNRYAYTMEGYDDAWREVGALREATYTNLPPGNYTFRVKAANSDGVWNEEGTFLSITILPPWWKTWWAYTLYALLLIGAAAQAYRWQRARLLRAANIEQSRLRAEAAELQAQVLDAENARQRQELEAARALQLSLLPDEVPEHPSVTLAASMHTATEVGGDYYDFHISDNGILTLAIGDATGHGLRAGTMVTATKTLFSFLAADTDLEQALLQSSAVLRRMGMPKLYMALALARLDGNSLELIGAGMPSALLYRSAEETVEKIALKGMPLGGPGDGRYAGKKVVLTPGDTVAFMSDGFPELRSASGQLFGYDEVVSVFGEVASGTPSEIVGHFAARCAEWNGRQAPDDDITFVVMKMKDGVR